MSNKETLYSHLINEKRDEAVLLAVEMLENKEIGVLDLYENILRMSLYDVKCEETDTDCIWKEHVRTAIVRTVMECAYPYLIKEKAKSKNKKVIVVCPSEEYHEIGAKMIHDFFSLAGYDSTFVGANTPESEILLSLKYIKPDYLAISVTNYYNIINTKKIIEHARTQNENLKVIVGGQAFKSKKILDSVDADLHLESYEDILSLEDKSVSV